LDNIGFFSISYGKQDENKLNYKQPQSPRRRFLSTCNGGAKKQSMSENNCDRDCKMYHTELG
jgi:hypothetical protein